ncbi:hypothetical protein TVAG_114840 [Trichomonas vaginalis G3]|uniref:Uncharacterized protein n=1 Tax=Trichomonas vaginalis (strain ATCC PRA-98 / G3) TaxID=412133 RepID=A2FGK7_TRIV3|nr:pectin lyase-like family [Trichomonas vaginalis G3]EAX95973.1 hypothetical protein TVAG_114840 [Trichomonas vaginalis G3]KAI5540471.1 pectin lyase-like family [Trichomonas vaginalis G3]|eukprot:XP_001308903.1 hypothetical protein [Trichomonas vaginalis G3]
MLISKSFSSLFYGKFNLKLQGSKFSHFLKPVIYFDSTRYITGAMFRDTQTFTDAKISQCEFYQIQSHAIYCNKNIANISISRSTFFSCYAIEKYDPHGGAIYFIDFLLEIEASSFTSCYCLDTGSCLFINSSKAFIDSISISNCSLNRPCKSCTSKVASKYGKMKFVNNSLSLTPKISAFYVTLTELGGIEYITTANSKRDSINVYSSAVPLHYGNIINCSAESGLFSCSNKDTFITSYYFSMNDGYLCTFEKKNLLIFTDCIFLDYDSRPNGGNFAIRGTFYLKGANFTPIYNTPVIEEVLQEKHTLRKLVAFLVFLIFIILSGFILFKFYMKNIPDYEEPSEKIESTSTSPEDTSENQRVITKRPTKSKTMNF